MGEGDKVINMTKQKMVKNPFNKGGKCDSGPKLLMADARAKNVDYFKTRIGKDLIQTSKNLLWEEIYNHKAGFLLAYRKM